MVHHGTCEGLCWVLIKRELRHIIKFWKEKRMDKNFGNRRYIDNLNVRKYQRSIEGNFDTKYQWTKK